MRMSPFMRDSGIRSFPLLGLPSPQSLPEQHPPQCLSVLACSGPLLHTLPSPPPPHHHHHIRQGIGILLLPLATRLTSTHLEPPGALLQAMCCPGVRGHPSPRWIRMASRPALGTPSPKMKRWKPEGGGKESREGNGKRMAQGGAARPRWLGSRARWGGGRRHP